MEGGGMKYPTYPTYKESGVAWLGEVPEHWEIWKIAQGFINTGSGTTPPSDNDTWYDGNIPWVTTSELRENVISDTAKKVSKVQGDGVSLIVY
jgi:type I restriction enzyme S subunit